MPRTQRKKIPIEQQKVRGNRGYFAGEPLEFLQSYIPEYIATLGNRENFWSKFQAEWEAKYPSKLTSSESREVQKIIAKYNLERNTGTREGKDAEAVTNDDGDEPANDDGDGDGDEDEPVPGPSTDINPTDAADKSSSQPLLTSYLPNYPPIPYPPVDASDSLDASLDASPHVAEAKADKGKSKAKESTPNLEVAAKGKKGKKNIAKRSSRENELLARAVSFAFAKVYSLTPP
jgi:hypothetical protein